MNHANTHALDVQRAVALVNANLGDLGFVPRDADGNDFANSEVEGLRFKTGTAYGEVTTLVLLDDKQVEALRATSWAGIDRMVLAIRGWIDRPRRERVAIHVEGVKEPVAEFEV